MKNTATPHTKKQKAAATVSKEITATELLGKSLITALEHYSNVHRGSGQAAIVSTRLYERSREIILDYFGFDRRKYALIFCSTRRAGMLKSQISPKDYMEISSGDVGLPLGIVAIALKKKALPKGIPFESGGGTTRLISKNWVLWSKPPDKFEAGTPATIPAIALARVLQLKKQGLVFTPVNREDNEPGEKDFILNDIPDASGKVLLKKLTGERIGKNLEIPTSQGNKPYINLDNAASTPTFSPVWEAFKRALSLPPNAHGDVIREAKTICHDFLDAPEENYHLVFTSNTTEAINIAAGSLKKEAAHDSESVVLVTLLEHSSNDLPWRYAAGLPVIHLDVDEDGFIDLQQLENTLTDYNQKKMHGNKRIRLMAVCGASNVLGSYNDIEQISSIVHRYGAELLVDAAQMAGHRNISMQKYNIDYLALSGHKVYAPFGSSLLMAKKGMLRYEDHETDKIKRSGEENVAGIAALGKALSLLQRIGMDVIEQEERELTVYTLDKMRPVPRMKIFGIHQADSPRFAQKGGVIPFDLKGVLPGKVAYQLALQGGIGVRYGCHCAHILVKHMHGVSPFIEKFQRLILRLFPKLNLPGVVRVSLGIYNTKSDIDSLAAVLTEMANRPKSVNKDVQGSAKMMEKFVKTITDRVFNK